MESLMELTARTCFLILAFAFVFLPVEGLWSQSEHSPRTPKQWCDGLFFFFATSFTSALCIAPLVTLLLTQRLKEPPFELLPYLGLSGLTQTIFLLFMGDGLAYLLHRMLHHFSIGWAIHKEHHEDHVTDWLSTTRQHPIDQILLALAFGCPVIILAPSWATTTTLALLLKFHSTLSHSRTPWSFGPLYWVIVSPAYHQLHHRGYKNPPRNLAHIFPIFDLAFSTAQTVEPSHLEQCPPA